MLADLRDPPADKTNRSSHVHTSAIEPEHTWMLDNCEVHDTGEGRHFLHYSRHAEENRHSVLAEVQGVGDIIKIENLHRRMILLSKVL